MQRNQIISYARTIGLVVGALLFVLLVFRSGQSTTSEAAVKGKPFLWSGAHKQGTAGAYTAFNTPDISPAAAVQPASTSTDTPAATSSEKPKAANNKDGDIAKRASNAVENSTRDIHVSATRGK